MQNNKSYLSCNHQTIIIVEKSKTTKGAISRTVTTEMVKGTDHYKSMNKVRQNITRSYNNIKTIGDGFNIAKTIGFAEFERRTNYSFSNREIIKELLNQ